MPHTEYTKCTKGKWLRPCHLRGVYTRHSRQRERSHSPIREICAIRVQKNISFALKISHAESADSRGITLSRFFHFHHEWARIYANRQVATPLLACIADISLTQNTRNAQKASGYARATSGVFTLGKPTAREEPLANSCDSCDLCSIKNISFAYNLL